MALAGPTRGGIDLPAALADLVRGVGTSRDAARLEASITDIPRADAPAAETAARAVRPFVRLLDHVGADGIPLTGAGYLPPVHVRALAEELGITDTWIGELNREVQTVPVLAFRDAAQRAKLVRKHRGTLVPTPAGRTLRTGPVGMWWHLATHSPSGPTSASARRVRAPGRAAPADRGGRGLGRRPRPAHPGGRAPRFDG